MINIAHTEFIGRENELNDLLTSLTDGDNTIQGCLKFVSGTAGIGKSWLLAEVAKRVTSLGSRVLWSQRIENPAAPPFFTWVLVLRSCLANYDDNELVSDLGRGASDIADLVPELRDRLQLTSKKPIMDSITARFQMFDSVSRFLLASAKRQPLVILLDNLHLADRSSLELLEYFSQQISNYPVVVIAAHRTLESDCNEPLKSTLNRLSLSARFSQFPLDGLKKQEVAQLLQFYAQLLLPTSLVESVYQQSGGNPLFVTEIAKVLRKRSVDQSLLTADFHFDLPDSLRAVILARLNILPSATRLMLGQASVLGRTFDILAWSEIVEKNTNNLMQAIQSAEDAGIVTIVNSGKFRFQHALFREVLYSELNLTERTDLHLAAAFYFEKLWDKGSDTVINLLAYHFFEVASYGYSEKAVHYNRIAAEEATERRAYSETARFLQNALIALEQNADVHFKAQFRLLLALGMSLFRSGQQNFASEPLVRAAKLAEKAKQWHALAEALAELQFVCGQQGILHKVSLPLHQTLLDNLPRDAHALRTRAMASLSDAYRLQGKFELANKTSVESMELARKLDDPVLRLDCYCRGSWAISSIALNPQATEYRRNLSLEIRHIAETYGSLEDILLIMSTICFDLTSRSSAEELQQHLVDFRRLLDSVYHPHYLNVLAGFEISINILQGKWQDAMKNALALRSRAITQDAAGIEGGFGQQMFVMQRVRGQLAGAAALIKRIEADIDPDKLWLPGQILLHCDLNNWQRARELLVIVGAISQLKQDDLYLASLVYLSEACIALNDRLRLIELYKLLKPFRYFIALIPGTVSMGAVAGYMASIAVHLDKRIRARELFEEAIALNSRMDAAPWLARVQTEYVQFLLPSKNNKDIAYAQELMASATIIASKFELLPTLAILRDLRTGTYTEQLTKRERAVLKLVASGMSNKVIAVEMSVSLNTVASHVRNILRKLRVANRTEASDFARRAAWLE